MILLFQNEYIAADFCRCTCSFQSRCTTTYNYNIAVLVDFKRFINIAFRYSRVNCTTDRTVYTDTVSGTSHVT